MNKIVRDPEVSYNYRDRHPIVLAEAPYNLDILPPSGERIDKASAERIGEFVASYRKFGRGQITLLAPSNGTGGKSRASIDEVRRVLAAAGAGQSLYVGVYPVSDPNLAAPIRISFVGVKAKVGGACGEWPEDLASGTSVDGWQNRSYYNFGCANQATLAAQIADPRDLVAPSAESHSDIETRMRAISKVRAGSDPSTVWTTKSSSISGVGGN